MDHIPFVFNQDSADLVQRFYGDSRIVHVRLDRASSVPFAEDADPGLWIDPAFENVENAGPEPEEEDENSWLRLMRSFDGFSELTNVAFQRKPSQAVVSKVVTAVLNKCTEFNPRWISVPQLATGPGSSRNKINRALARATGEWQSSTGFSGDLVVPLVITNKRHVQSKVDRNSRVDLVLRCVDEAHASGYWVVDTSLSEEVGSPGLRSEHFKTLLNLHRELNELLEVSIRVGGPYWGMNLVLWARELVDFPAIGVGSAYQHYLAGPQMKRSQVARIALAPLRRRVVNVNLERWLDHAVGRLGTAHPASLDFSLIRKRVAMLKDPDTARTQVAEFYKKWFNSIAAVPQGGRSMALFQDLSAAFALGRMLDDLDEREKAARAPESVAEPLMLNCL